MAVAFGVALFYIVLTKSGGARMVRLLACLVVFVLASPALGDTVAEDKNWGDKQTAGGKKSNAPTTKNMNFKPKWNRTPRPIDKHNTTIK